MVRLSLQRHVPVLVATGALAIGCGPRVLGADTDGTDDATGTSNSSDPTVNPTDPSGNPTSDPTVNPTMDPTVDPTATMPLPGPPQLIDAVVRDAFTVELFFSEPIAAITAIDPTKFRMSAAFSNSYYNDSTWYADLGQWNGEEVCMEYCYGSDYGDSGGQHCNEWCYTPPGPQVHVQSIVNSPYADRAIMALDQPMTANLCKQLANKIETNGATEAALFLHYSNNGAGITDQDGEQLDAIAEHWVLLSNQTYSYQQGTFPFMNPYIPIACPF